jgi:hypothetical protein
MIRNAVIVLATIAALASPAVAKMHRPGDGNADLPSQRPSAAPCDDGSGGLQDKAAMKGTRGKDGRQTALAACGAAPGAQAAPAAGDPQALKGHRNGVGQ